MFKPDGSLDLDFVDVAINQLEERKEKIKERMLFQNKFLFDLENKINSDPLFKLFAEKLLIEKGLERWKNILLKMYIDRFEKVTVDDMKKLINLY